jgi:hypothetical protein
MIAAAVAAAADPMPAGPIAVAERPAGMNCSGDIVVGGTVGPEVDSLEAADGPDSLVAVGPAVSL